MAALPQMAFNACVVGTMTLHQSQPSLCKMVPAPPTIQTSSGLVPQMLFNGTSV